MCVCVLALCPWLALRHVFDVGACPGAVGLVVGVGGGDHPGQLGLRLPLRPPRADAGVQGGCLAQRVHLSQPRAAALSLRPHRGQLHQ